MRWINWLNQITDNTGYNVGTMVCGPVPDDNGSAYYVIRLRNGHGPIRVDYKDILIQRHKGGSAEHYSGR